MVIGIQRALAVFAPIWFHKNGRNRFENNDIAVGIKFLRSSFLFASTLVILLPTLLIGFVIAYRKRNVKVIFVKLLKIKSNEFYKLLEN